MPLGAYTDEPWLFKYATLYRHVAEVSGGSIGPDQVDLWESWQAGAFLGRGLPIPDDATPGSGGRDVLGERIAYLEAVQRGESPEPPTPDPPAQSTAPLLAAFEDHT